MRLNDEKLKTIEAPVLNVQDFGEINGKSVSCFHISFPGKLKAKLTNYGAILMELKTPNAEGVLEDVVVGHDNLEAYIADTYCLGATVGRCCNRIAHGKMTIDNVDYQLSVNNGGNHLHGGISGFDKKVWQVEDTVLTPEAVRVKLSYLSIDGEEGYPGNLKVFVTYSFSQTGFEVQYEAETDKTTIANFTHHSYFNLSGSNRNVLDHKLKIEAEDFLPVSGEMIPMGELMKVEGTPFDFTEPKALQTDLNVMNNQLKIAKGYDHSFVLKGQNAVAELSCEESGRIMTVSTDRPALHIYVANYWDSAVKGRNGDLVENGGVCLETQGFPNAINQPNFPSVLLQPEEKFTSKTAFNFSIENRKHHPNKTVGMSQLKTINQTHL